MLDPDRALQLVLEQSRPLAPASSSILDALGCVLGEDLSADGDLPPWPNSAVDGYAVQAASTRGASPANPARLRVLGQLGAGSVFEGRVEPGETVKIMTGAPMPDGADSVVMVEDSDGAATGSVELRRECSANDHVRPQGEDVKQGELVLTRGRAIRPSEIAMIAALGRHHVDVHRRPRVAVLATGDELREPGEPLGPGMIRNSAAYALLAQAAAAGAVPISLGICPDQPDELLARMRLGLEQADVLVTCGGVSMGEFDFVPGIMRELGARILFDRVAMAPGKPTTFAVAGERLLFGLPGNPVSSMVAFELFARPALLRLGGHVRLSRPTARARLATEFRKRAGRRMYLRGKLEAGPDGTLVVAPVATQSSGALRSMAEATVLAIIEAETERVPAGTELLCLLLDHPETAVLPGAGQTSEVP